MRHSAAHEALQAGVMFQRCGNAQMHPEILQTVPEDTSLRADCDSIIIGLNHIPQSWLNACCSHHSLLRCCLVAAVGSRPPS
jgi:hypothetical protein